MVLRMAMLTDDADYDAGETFENVPRPLFNFGNDHSDNGLRTSCVPLTLLTNMTMVTVTSLLCDRFPPKLHLFRNYPSPQEEIHNHLAQTGWTSTPLSCTDPAISSDRTTSYAASVLAFFAGSPASGSDLPAAMRNSHNLMGFGEASRGLNFATGNDSCGVSGTGSGAGGPTTESDRSGQTFLGNGIFLPPPLNENQSDTVTCLTTAL
ncbi:unnamed protein product [Protopolystoma xenopodis]|uniref:Uncharacterized protein n=1 Tax=Protopolystoma xenopodis TaxID=117903 RepID=A0A3S5AM65_9PLAT|nr:unnamed protein product [Protopolystoma xenopodis]